MSSKEPLQGRADNAWPPPDILPVDNLPGHIVYRYSTSNFMGGSHGLADTNPLQFSPSLNHTEHSSQTKFPTVSNPPTPEASENGPSSAANNDTLLVLNQLLDEVKSQSARQDRRFEEQISILSQMNNRQSQQDFSYQPIPQVSVENASVWDPLHRSMMNNISPTLDKWRGGLDTLLVFVGLFSGIVTSFLVDSFNQIQPDPVERTNELLLNLTEIVVALSRGDNITLHLSEPLDFVPDPAGVRLNVYWALSLVIALTAAALAVLARGFISRLVLPEGTARSRVIDLYQRWPNAQRTFGPLMSWLPLTLIMPVALFIIGLLDAMITSASMLAKPNVALVVMSVLGCMIVTLAVGLGITSMVHGTLHPNASPFKIRIPLLGAWWNVLRSHIPTLTQHRPVGSIISGYSTEIHTEMKGLSAFHNVLGKTYEDPFLDAAAGALDSILKHPLASKTRGIYPTMIHLLSPEASIRCSITVATTLFNRHTSTSLAVISGLPFSPEDGVELLRSLIACVQRNPRLYSVPCGQDDPTPVFSAVVAITLVHYVDHTKLSSSEFSDAFGILSKAVIAAPASTPPPMGMSYVLTASARMIAYLWSTSHPRLDIGSNAGIYISDQGSSLTSQTKTLLLSSLALKWVPQVTADLNAIGVYIRRDIHDLLTSIPSVMENDIPSAHSQFDNLFSGSTGDLTALLLGILFWGSDMAPLSSDVWKCILDWIGEKFEARSEVSIVDYVIGMEMSLSGQGHINFAERLSYLAIKRTRSKSANVLKVCSRVLNTTWRPFQYMKHLSARPFKHLILSNQDIFDEVLSIFVREWNEHKDDINTNIQQVRSQAEAAFANVFTILFIALSHGLNVVNWYEEWSRAEFLHIVVRKVLILSALEPTKQSHFVFTLSALCIHAIVSQPTWSRHVESTSAEIKALIQGFIMGVDQFIATTHTLNDLQLPLQGDILYVLHDKTKMDPSTIVAKTLIRLHEGTVESAAAPSFLRDSTELSQQLLTVYERHKDWIYGALVYKNAT